MGIPKESGARAFGIMDEESRLEDVRRRGDAGYPVGRHIEVLIALMAEVRLLPRSIPV